jgi:predicted exporter
LTSGSQGQLETIIPVLFQHAATEEKTILEEAQRAAARERKALAKEWNPKHFELVGKLGTCGKNPKILVQYIPYRYGLLDVFYRISLRNSMNIDTLI